MRRKSLLLIACVALVWSGAAAAQARPGGAQSNSSMPGARAPVRQPSTSPSPSAPVPPANTSPPPSAPTPSPANTSPPPSTPTPESSSMPQQTVVPNQPDCSQMTGIEKSECERRDTVRDDLPAGVTTTQQPKPPR